MMELAAADSALSTPKPRKVFAWQRFAPLALVLVAAVFRIWALDLKPPHFDEGINGWFVDRMVAEGSYQYDPTNYHGPLHFYVLLVSQTLFGRNLWALRMPVVLVGLATIWLAWQFRRHLGDRAAVLAALGLAVSPGYVFYQRYSIHESWLVLFLMLMVWGLFGLAKKGDRRSLWAAVGGLTGMILTKETYIIHVVSMALAFVCLQWIEKKLPTDRPLVVAEQRWTRRDLLQAGTLSVFLIVFFYSGNFFHFERLAGLVTTFGAWFQTGVGNSGHEKALYQLGPLNYFWLALCWEYEPFAVIGLVMCGWALFRVDWQVRWLAIYGAGCLTAYSIIPYKTPWCLISIIWPFFLLAGVLLDRLWRTRLDVLALVLLLGAGRMSVLRAADLNFGRYDDDTEPYVYVQTWRDIRNLLGPIQSVLKREPGRVDMSGGIYISSYYPLPWLFGDFQNISYSKEEKISAAKDADFLICEEKDVAKLEEVLQESYHRVHFRLRSGMNPCVAWFNDRMFAPEFAGHSPDFTGIPMALPVEE